MASGQLLNRQEAWRDCFHMQQPPFRAGLRYRAFRDTTFGDYRVVEQDVDGCEMIYCLMKAPFPVSNRDFLQVSPRIPRGPFDFWLRRFSIRWAMAPRRGFTTEHGAVCGAMLSVEANGGGPGSECDANAVTVSLIKKFQMHLQRPGKQRCCQ